MIRNGIVRHHFSLNRLARAAAFFLGSGIAISGAAAAPQDGAHSHSHVHGAPGDSATGAAPAVPVAETARQILSSCARARVRYDCVAAATLDVVDRSGAAYTMEVLEELITRQPALRPDAHGLAHAIGIRAYRSRATLAEVFAGCPPTHLSGCYHGVMQAAFLDLRETREPVTDSLLESLCSGHRAVSNGLYFQCIHGVGHGLMALHENDLPAALRTCDLFAARSDAENCHAGAVMENLIVATHPHHSALAHASDRGRDPHATHAAAGGEHEHEHEHGSEHPDGDRSVWVPLNRDDHQYPCSALAAQYQAGCYNMQSSMMLYLNGGDPARTAADCERAPEQFVVTCLRSLGRDVFALSGGDHARGARTCSALGPSREMHCLTGFVHSVINIRAVGEDGIPFCEAVRGERQRSTCYSAIGEMVYAMGVPPASRSELCARVTAEHRADCAAGAGVPASQAPPVNREDTP